MKIAALGDIHHYQLAAWPWHLLGKRALGMANLWLRRRGLFQSTLLPAVLDRIASIQPDLTLFTGDLSTTALPGEFATLKRMLDPFLDAHPSVVIPGNHDRYSFASYRRRRMETFFGDHMPAAYPHVRDLTSCWRLLVIDSAVPRKISSRGRIGDEQLQAITDWLEKRSPDEGVLVMCHYPAVFPEEVHPKPHHRLEEDRVLAMTLEKCPARVVMLHGHVHKPWYLPVTERYLDLNVGSPTMTREPYPLGQGFWELTLHDEPAATITLVHHHPQPQADTINWYSHVVP